MKKIEYVSVRDFAKHFDISPQAVRKRIAAGDIVSHWVGKMQIIPKTEIKEFEKLRRKK